MRARQKCALIGEENVEGLGAGERGRRGCRSGASGDATQHQRGGGGGGGSHGNESKFFSQMKTLVLKKHVF